VKTWFQSWLVPLHLAAGPEPTQAHWRAYVELLPREVDSLLEWDPAQLAMLQGSGHAARARERIALVDGVYREVFPALTDADPSLFGGGGTGTGTGTGTAAGMGTGTGIATGTGTGTAAGTGAEIDDVERRQRQRLRLREKSREMKAARAARRFTSKEAFRWAFATVLARAFELPDMAVGGGGGGEMGSCPGLDLFNHGSEAGLCISCIQFTHHS
jgi:hypothetical protein